MDKWRCTPKDVEITTNTTLRPENYGDWMAVNTGTGNVSVDGFVLEPGDGLPFMGLQPNVIWNKQIQIVILTTGGKVLVRRLLYSAA